MKTSAFGAEEPTEDPTSGATNLVDTEIVDSNTNGVVDLGDVLVLHNDGEVDETVGDGADDIVTLTDTDGSVITVDCRDQRCLRGDSDLNGELDALNPADLDVDALNEVLCALELLSGLLYL